MKSDYIDKHVNRLAVWVTNNGTFEPDGKYIYRDTLDGITFEASFTFPLEGSFDHRWFAFTQHAFVSGFGIADERYTVQYYMNKRRVESIALMIDDKEKDVSDDPFAGAFTELIWWRLFANIPPIERDSYE